MDQWLVEDAYGQVLLHPHAPDSALASLAGSEWYLVRQGVAERTDNPEVLTKLARDKTASVRRAVAANPSAPRPTLTALSRDKNAGVRQGVALNASTPVELLNSMADDEHLGVRMTLAENPNLPSQARASLNLK